MKRVLILLIAVISVSSVHAQVRFGIRTGLNVTNLYSDDEFATFKTGFQVGVVTNIAFNRFLSLQPGFHFAQMGAQKDNDISMTLNYIQIPVNLQAKFGGFFLQTGPYLGYGIDVDTSRKSNNGTTTKTSSFEDVGAEPIDLGMGAGLGGQIGPVQMAFNTQYSLVSINKGSYPIKNLGLAFTVTYFFGR